MRECDLPKEMATLIGCDYSAIVGQKDDKLLRSMIKRAYECGAENGFATLVIECNDENLTWLSDNARLQRNTSEFRNHLLSEIADGKRILDTLTEERTQENSFDFDTSSEFSVRTVFEPLGECFELDGSPKDVMLAYIPADKPYEAIAWFPQFNDILSEAEMLAVMRYWYECYDTVPTMVGCNYIEFSSRKLSYDEALSVAVEQYALAPLVVDEGAGSVSALADMLMRSDTWLLWW